MLLTNARTLTAETKTLEPVDILVRDGLIADIAPVDTIDPTNKTVFDATDRLVMPGWMNAHSHGQLSLCKGCNDRWNLELLLSRLPSLTAHRTAEFHYLSAQISAAEMISKGCTAVYDLFSEFPAPTPEGVDAVCQAYIDIGMRAVVAPMMADRTFFCAIPGLIEAFPESLRKEVERVQFAPHQESIARCRTILESWHHDRQRVRPALAPTIPHHCTDDFLVACRDLAKEFDIGIQMHIMESRMQAVVAPEIYGCTAISHLSDLGLLGAKFTAAHSVWLSDEDISRLADSGASVAHNPGSNLRLGSGIAKARKLLDAKINVAIGTDAAITSDNLNMFEAVRLAAIVSRVQETSTANWLSAAEVYKAGTQSGAVALGFGERFGRLDIGCHADLVLLDLSRPVFVPLGNSLNQLIYSEDGTSVATVIIGGDIVYNGGKFLTIDYPALVERVREAAAILLERTAGMTELAERLEPVVRSYCEGLAQRPFA